MKIQATVITDASWCSRTHAAGWAAWASSSHFKFARSGTFHLLPASNTIAENWAALNGVYLCYKQGARSVLLQSDCLNTVGSINTKAVWVRKFLVKFKMEDLYLEARHVKGHSNTNDARSWVNAWCDKYAKRAMNIRRQEIDNERAKQA